MNYWLVLVCMVLAYTIVLFGLPALGHIIVCSFLGSYAMVAALSHYVGANLQYIVVNMFRRAVVENFNLAMVDPPYQEKGRRRVCKRQFLMDDVSDINLTISWIFFFLSGVYAQVWLQKGKPPFPPHRALLIERNRENTPLLIDSPLAVVYTE